MSAALTHDLPFASYQAIPAWNWSVIKLLEDGSPRHVQYARKHGSPDTASRGMLRAIHALVLEGQAAFDRAFVLYEGRRAGKAFDEFSASHAGATVLNPREYDATRGTAEAVLAHPEARALLLGGEPEVTVTWTDDATGLPCKGRIDWLGDAIVDLKTIGTTNERSVGQIVARNLYHGQVAHYDAGARANGIEVPSFLICAESSGPYDVAVFEVDEGIPDGSMHVGRELRKRLMAQLAECVRTDFWPGRHRERRVLCLPSYALLDQSDEITVGAESAGTSEETL